MTAQALEQSVLESKDKTQLIQIAEALGVKANARNKKADIIDQILDQDRRFCCRRRARRADRREDRRDERREDRGRAVGGCRCAGGTCPRRRAQGRVGARCRHRRRRRQRGRRRPRTRRPAPARARRGRPTVRSASKPRRDVRPPPARRTNPVTASDRSACRDDDRRRLARPSATGDGAAAEPRRRSGPQRRSEPQRSVSSATTAAAATTSSATRTATAATRAATTTATARAATSAAGVAARAAVARRPAGRGPTSSLEVDDARRRSATSRSRSTGYLDLRDEGYGFLRVDGYLASRDDAYIPVKLTRQYGLRKGDHVTGLQPSGRPQREEPGDARDPHGQRRRPRGGQEAPAVRGPHGAVPRRAAAPRGPVRPDQHDGADHRPRLADRQGPARHHRVAARRPARRRS